MPTVFVEIESDIPMAAGLGSSAAASVAGLRIFERVTAPVSDGTLLAVATSLEGHADNAAAALLGGMTSVVEARRHAASCVRCDGSGRTTCDSIVATPFTGLATSKARAALAPSISRQDAVFNLQRVLSLVHALQHGEYDRLREALQDRWHQPARAALVPHLGAVLAHRRSRRARRLPVGRGAVGCRAGATRFRASRAAAAGDVRSGGIPGDRQDAGRASGIE